MAASVVGSRRPVVGSARLILVAAGALWSAQAFTPLAADQAQFFTGAHNVALYVTVTGDGGRLADGLKSEDFEVFDNGKRRTLTVFQNTPVPITLAAMLDYSPSLKRAWPTVREAAVTMVRRLGPLDRATVGFFHRTVRIEGAVTGDVSELLHRLSMPSTTVAGTALWDAVAAGMGAVEDEPGRRVVLVLTDGNDNSSETTGEAIAAQAVQQDVMLYAIGMRGSDRIGGQLGRIARESGGWYFELKRDDSLDGTFARVVDELRHQYLLGFSVDSLDGAVHRLEVRVKRRGLKVRARTSYVAAKPTGSVAGGGVYR